MPTNNIDLIAEKEMHQQNLVNSLLYFTKIFYYLRTGRTFDITYPPGRESHYISICRELEDIFDGKNNRLVINVPPRYGKTELVIQFIAWAMAQYPDSNNLYVSYSHSLAKKQTQTIRNIIQMPEYMELFDIKIKGDNSAKDNFETVQGGSVYAAGAGGSITGRGAGVKNAKRFGGCIIIDDIIKPDEATSDTVRDGINEWYYNTLQSRTNSPDTPIIFIGQRVHENDLADVLMKSGFKSLVIPAIDVAGNALHPEMHSLATLRKMEHDSPYNFASQYQQNPQPAGGGIFKKEWFRLHEIEPKMVATFIVGDSAETDKSYNDATVFGHIGLYKILHEDIDTGLYGIHVIDLIEERVEPKDLKPLFLNFYSSCMRHAVKPQLAAIEKKSTGVTLLSVLKEYQGLQLIEIERTVKSGSKIARFLATQPYAAQGLISFPADGKHTQMCIKHMGGITANNSHRHDDIADVICDGVRLALIDKTVLKRQESTDYSAIAKGFAQSSGKIERIRNRAYKV